MAWGYSEIAYCQIWDLESCHVTLKLIKMTAETASQENITIMAYESRKRKGKIANHNENLIPRKESSNILLNNN